MIHYNNLLVKMHTIFDLELYINGTFFFFFFMKQHNHMYFTYSIFQK